MARGIVLLILVCQSLYVQADLEVMAVSDTTRKKHKHHIPTLTVDRPDQTDSPYVIPVGFFQIETGMQYVWDKYTSDGISYSYKSFTYPNLLLRYGIVKRVELRLEENFSRDRIRSRKVRRPDGKSAGWYPALLAVKVLLVEQKGLRPNIAILAKLATPYHSRKHYPRRYAPGLVGAFSHSISDRFVLDGSAGGMIDQLTKKVNVSYSLSQAVGLTEKLSMFVEVFCFKPAGEQVQYATDVGLLYMVIPNLQLDIYASKSLSYQAADVFAGAGVGFRLPR